MVYSEWHDDSEGCIVNFIEGFENAKSWAQHYFDQYHDVIPFYEEFHWQSIPIRVLFHIEKELNFHPDEPHFSITNGFGSCFAVAIDGDFKTEELKNIKEINANAFPWSHIIETLIVRNEKELKWKYN